MNESQNYYATPEAELGADDGVDAPLEGVGGAPTTFGGTLSAIFRLYPKVLLPLVGYCVLGVVVMTVFNGISSVIAGASMAVAGPLGLLVSVVGAVVGLALMAFFWALITKRIDNLYRHGTKGGEFSFAGGKFISVGIAFLLKILFVGLFHGVATGLFVFIGLGVDSGIGVLMMLAVFFGIPFVGWILYLFIHFADMAVICENAGAIDGISRSWQLVKGWRNWFYTFGLGLVIGGLLFIFYIAFYCISSFMFGMLIGGGEALAGSPEAGIAVMIVSIGIMGLLFLALVALIVPFFAVANYMVFQSLVARWRRRSGIRW